MADVPYTNFSPLLCKHSNVLNLSDLRMEVFKCQNRVSCLKTLLLNIKFVHLNILNFQPMKNLKKKILAVAVLGLLSFTQSCKSGDNNNYQMDNQSFVNQALSSNNFEIAAGTLATTNSSNTLVQQFGAKMISEHRSVGVDLSAIAVSKELSVSTPLQAKEQSNLNTLISLSGSQFDAQFINMMIVSHQDAVSLFQNASGSEGVADGDLRNFAGSKVPLFQAHLKNAQNLQSQVNLAP